MSKIFQRVRGLLGLGAIGAALGTLWGIGLLVHREVWTWWSWDMAQIIVMFIVLPYAVCGLVVGAGFGLLLTAGSGQLTLFELPMPHIAFYGAAAGVAVPALLIAAYPSSYGPGAYEFIQWALLGAVAGTAAVLLARRAGRAELQIVEEVRSLSDGA